MPPPNISNLARPRNTSPTEAGASATQAQIKESLKHPKSTTDMATVLFAAHAEKNWMEALNDMIVQQPNVADVLMTLDWLLPEHPSQVLSLQESEIELPESALTTEPSTYRLRVRKKPVSDHGAQSRPNRFYGLLNKLGLGGQNQAECTVDESAGNTNPRSREHSNEQFLPHLKLLKTLLIDLIDQIRNGSGTQRKSDTLLIRSHGGYPDISVALRDQLLKQIRNSSQIHESVNEALIQYPALSCLIENPSIENLIFALQSIVDLSPDNSLTAQHLPSDVRQAILFLYPEAAPVLSLISRSLLLAGSSSKPVAERFLPFGHSDETYTRRHLHETPCYYKTFLTGIERLAETQSGFPQWRGAINNSQLRIDHYGQLLSHALQGLIASDPHRGSAVHRESSTWPIALHVLTNRQLGLPLSQAAVDADRQNRLDVEQAKQLNRDKEEYQKQYLAEEKVRKAELNRQFKKMWETNGVTGIYSNSLVGYSPDTRISELSIDESVVLNLPSQRDMSTRETLRQLLGTHHRLRDMSARPLINKNALGNLDNRCWLRAAWTSVLYQLPTCDAWKLEAPAFSNNPAQQLWVSKVLCSLKKLYENDPDKCLGINSPLDQRPVHICPNHTIEDFRRQVGVFLPKTFSDQSSIEDVLHRLTMASALGFRFENRDYAQEVERTGMSLNAGGSSELPIGLHRALLLPTLIVELASVNSSALTIRIALPKDDPRYPHWQRIKALLATEAPNDGPERLTLILSLFRHLPILYLDRPSAGDQVGHFQVFVPTEAGSKTESRSEAAKTRGSSPHNSSPNVTHDGVGGTDKHLQPNRLPNPHITGLIRNAEGHLTQVVAASERDTASRPQLADHVRERLVSLLQDPYACLVAFGSPASAERLKHHSQHHALHPHSSSLIEQTLAALKAAKAPLELAPNLWLERVDLDHNPTFSRGNDTMTGRLMLRNTAGAQPVYRPIPFMLLHPPYDGVAMKATDLCHALHDLRRWLPRSAASADPAPCRPHFFSAGGVGRSASLAVLMSTVGLGKQPAKQSIDLSDIDVTIANVRSNGGHPDFVHTPEQLYEIQKAALATLQNDLAYNA